ncbi:hypothetical protein E0500_023470 [Streptomyces sp. KM273126]|uniref:hypothetical protein n=1 Tax=Streptomyces sp. KM273126 TaxID=2545247 RepID=UPI0015EC665C|nr:hypothetical protein [Streptomyces sp. KM273126]MBA2810269.1 hypothetical protein [Streptomyces sp. KM273126]
MVDPLTLPMCSPTTDGAAAVALHSESYARRHGRGRCEIRATCLTTGQGEGSAPVTVGALAAYEDACIGPEDLHLLELHDAAAPAEILQYAEADRPEEGADCLPAPEPRPWAGGCR